MPLAPRLTVLMPVYNGMPYLPEAIDSVLTQSFRDFEFLIIDDASSDGSVACIESYPDSRIRLVRNEHNGGQATSLNRGLSLARGQYIARLDQDDVCLPDRLKKQVTLLDKRPEVTVVGTLMTGMDLHGHRRGLLGRRMDDYGAFVASLLLAICPFCHPSVMFRRDPVLRAGGYDESLAPAEDVALWTKLALQRQQGVVIPESLGLHRFHEGQQSLTKAVLQQRCIRRAQQQIIETVCPPEQVRGVSLLLNLDDDLWKECPSKAHLEKVFLAFQETISHLKTTLHFTAQESVSFQRKLNRRLGPGIGLAPRMIRWPSWVFYPTLCLLSPLILPNVRSLLSRFAWSVRRLRYPVMAKRAFAIRKGMGK